MTKQTIRTKLPKNYSKTASKLMKQSHDYKQVKEVIERYNVATGRTRNYRTTSSNTSGIAIDTKNVGPTSKIS